MARRRSVQCQISLPALQSAGRGTAQAEHGRRRAVAGVLPQDFGKTAALGARHLEDTAVALGVEP
jgi:hypothetical protein